MSKTSNTDLFGWFVSCLLICAFACDFRNRSKTLLFVEILTSELGRDNTKRAACKNHMRYGALKFGCIMTPEKDSFYLSPSAKISFSGWNSSRRVHGK